MKRSVRGFTLLELMVVVSIVGMMATIAVTEYSKTNARAKRTEATTALMQLHVLQQAYEADQRQYASTFTDLGFQLPGGEVIRADLIKGERYFFQVKSDGQTWCGTATGNLDNDPFLDLVVIGNGC
jgi:prepilin-type N-terminal cleavage/methylation domain-containing protein